MATLAPQQTTALESNKQLFSDEEDQAHLFAHWPPPGTDDDKKRSFARQVAHLNRSYSGGLRKYISNARQLLEDSRTGKNPLEGYVPSVPTGIKLDFGSTEYQHLEELGAIRVAQQTTHNLHTHTNAGVQAAAKTAFVLVAGGLGERLGYSGIKVALPAETARGACFLQIYIESILALQSLGPPGTHLPLAIMTSDDTHARTQALLSAHDNFGMQAGQVTLIKQEKVPCLSDNDAHLALDPSDAYAIQTKPHGHGDVHALLHSSGLADAWKQAGLEWVAFFQDTNALVFRGLTVALGVSARERYDMNSLAVPRRAKEAIGGIALLTRPSGESMTVNVEYNQLDPLLRATVNPEGDVNDASGLSPYPGNINQLVVKLDTYAAQLHATGGVIGEFVNPKYADATRTAFKSSTRLESMMQDFPKSLPPSARVGFTVINQVWAAYSPVKNSPADAKAKAEGGNPSHSATTGELDLYRVHCETLRLCGAQVADPQSAVFNGLHVDVWPLVVWSPLFAVTMAQVKAKVQDLTLHPGAALVVNAPDARLRGLEVDGAVVVQGPGPVEASGRVANAGWRVEALSQDAGASEEAYMRCVAASGANLRSQVWFMRRRAQGV